MNRLERAAIEAVFESIFPAGMPGVPAAAELKLLPHLELQLEAMPPLHRAGVRAAFLACALAGPIALMGSPRTLMSLDPTEREECLSRLLGHPRCLVRQVGLLLKALACTAYFQDRRVRNAFGLPPAADPGPGSPP